jgi:hypothetical protein
MKRAILTAGLGAVMAIGLMTTAASAAPLGPAPLGPVGQPVAATDNELVQQVRYGHHHRSYGYRRSYSFGFIAPAYSYSNCWWSRRYHRRVCSY